MAKAKFDIKTEAARPLYAGVGVTDLAVEYVRGYVAGVQKNVSGLDVKPQALRDRALTTVNGRVEALSKDAKARRDAIESRVAELQSDARELPGRVQALLNDNVATVTSAYEDLAKRGETLVGRIRRQESTKATTTAAKTTTAKAKTTSTQAKKTAKKTTKTAASGAKSTAKKASTTAKKSSAKPSAKATATAAKATASNAATAATQAAEKVGD
ncbi:hypothetical protein [Nocardioides panaciterrulae]|uniref:Peptidoglycan hydrolase CwlO-like protein n=1 Tax=Nocardioides panaciterrulae TaxID=661492 RepID=A0A7Y9J9E7_9ACTN|nr:hypothetical protein [Nocardioides panaciterrulae]NYD40495.1 peptidoglycan hydrolase CwlO-like protein [Nocardioides panaciterrulae]